MAKDSKSRSKSPLPRKVKKMTDKANTPHVKRIVEDPIKEPKRSSKVSIRNNTSEVYNLTYNMTPVTLLPGLNSGFEKEMAESLVRDLNKAVPGDNNPFNVE